MQSTAPSAVPISSPVLDLSRPRCSQYCMYIRYNPSFLLSCNPISAWAGADKVKKVLGRAFALPIHTSWNGFARTSRVYSFVPHAGRKRTCGQFSTCRRIAMLFHDTRHRGNESRMRIQCVWCIMK